MDTAHSTQLKVVSGMKSVKLQLSQQSSNVDKVLVAQQNLVSDVQHTREEIQDCRILVRFGLLRVIPMLAISMTSLK